MKLTRTISMKHYWSQRPPAVGTKRFHVKVKPLKLEGFCKDDDEIEMEKPAVIVQMKWNRPKSVFLPFYRSSSSSKRNKNSTSQRIFKNGDVSIQWDDEFESICDFSVVSKDGSLCPWHVSFSVLYGESAESKTTKMQIWGKASLNLAEVAAKMESEVEIKIPVASKVDGVATAGAILLISVCFAEVRNSSESSSSSLGLVQNSAESDKGDAFFKKVIGFTGYKKKKKKNKSDQQAGSSESDESPVLADSDGSSGITNDNGNVEVSSGAELGSSSGSESQVDPVRKDGLFSWRRRGLSFRESKKKGEPLIKISIDDQVNADVEIDVNRQLNCSTPVDPTTSGAVQNAEAATEISLENESGNWEMKELTSRDGQTKLKANVFFASFDQRSEKAAGESACTALVAAIAHWLHSNQDSMPTKQEYDKLITQGSSDWRMLCNNEAYANFFPDKHFDLETVLEAGIHPISVLPDKSFTGFFSPEKFESLKGAMSFDEIWNEINNHTGVYIVSWNDHFFLLKVEESAYYIIDSLGERLFEGCNQAYILKFDDSSLMYGKVQKEEASSAESAMTEEADQEEKNGSCKDECQSHDEEMICSGKDCCKEYIKRFLAAIPLGELEVEEKKGTVSTFCLHKRLQIDFHYSSCSSSAITSSSSSPAISSDFSLFSCEESN